MMSKYNSDWLCIDCGTVLGEVRGGELYPAVDGHDVHTQGPHLVVTCKECGFRKVWYTSDKMVRAVYQLMDVITDEAAKAMIKAMGKAVRIEEQRLRNST